MRGLASQQVIAGLDPAIHDESEQVYVASYIIDCRL
jgi:hypothetical protein